MTGTALIATWITRQVVFNGTVQGLTIALVGLGIVLVFRATKVINFAVGNMGLPAAALMALMMINYELGFWLSLAVSLLVGAAFAAAVELIVVRRLFNAPRVILLVGDGDHDPGSGFDLFEIADHLFVDRIAGHDRDDRLPGAVR